ncbi:AMP-binding protein [Pyxidicoccus fallax]|uniref:AMP-binding protein n=1 Tax=Pyxidicoccus fallax TaxID=394095 RepID=A0A848LZN8_9BACT|nr:AMP-binding protein [Pyxidicoccus fallax]NMO23555.1 AMP-binding protein [Pyxidicoccus fallax]NPC86903.1 AMP-binding protein [Pyxidicoccus fallax]
MTHAPVPSYVHGTSTTPLLGETIGQNLRRTVEQYGDREALVVVSQGYRATYRQLWDTTTQVALGLLALGVEKGDRVGIWSPNRYEWVVAQYATARIGAILVNLNPAYRTSELEYALIQSGVSVLLYSRGFRQTDYRAMVEEVRPRCPGLRVTMVLDDDWQLLLSNGKHVSERTLTDREASLQFDDPINIQYTSGTTGFPKGATLSHHNVLNNGFFIGEALRYGPRDRVCIPVPFYHCFGMVIGNLACTSHGATMVIPGEAFDALAVLQTVQAERCTSLYGVPTMFIAELDHPRFGEFDLTSLRTGVMAGSPCPVEVMKQVQSRMNMREVTICYGMTETSPVSTQSALDDPLDKRVSTVGRVHPHLEVKVVDPDTGAVVPRGSPGELCTRGYSVMLGYWENPQATATAVDKAGWMHTGDLATMDEDGYLRIVGRIKDMIIRGGENIYPREVEEFLHTHPGVSEAQVIGVPSKKYGEEVMAWVKTKPGVTLTAEELTKHCTGRISTYKVPRYWKFVDAFPMTVTGKVQKFRMREVSIAELGLQDAADIKTA